MIQKPAFNPLYQQVKARLLGRIAAGEWPPGTFLPCETVLAREYGVSHGTLRKALNELTSEGRVQRFQGKGTAVPTFDSDVHFYRYFLMKKPDGTPDYPSSQVVVARKARAGNETARLLKLSPGAGVFQIERVRVLGGRAAINERIYLPLARFPGIEGCATASLPNTLYDFYQKRFGVTIGRAVEYVTAEAATATDAKRLELAEGAPLLAIRRVALDLREAPVELRYSRCATSRHGYTVELR